MLRRCTAAAAAASPRTKRTGHPQSQTDPSPEDKGTLTGAVAYQLCRDAVKRRASVAQALAPFADNNSPISPGVPPLLLKDLLHLREKQGRIANPYFSTTCHELVLWLQGRGVLLTPHSARMAVTLLSPTHDRTQARMLASLAKTCLSKDKMLVCSIVIRVLTNVGLRKAVHTWVRHAVSQGVILTEEHIALLLRECSTRGDTASAEVWWQYAATVLPWPPAPSDRNSAIFFYILSQRVHADMRDVALRFYGSLTHCPLPARNALLSGAKGDVKAREEAVQSILQLTNGTSHAAYLEALAYSGDASLLQKTHRVVSGNSFKVGYAAKTAYISALGLCVLLRYDSLESMVSLLTTGDTQTRQDAMADFQTAASSVRPEFQRMLGEVKHSLSTTLLETLLESAAGRITHRPSSPAPELEQFLRMKVHCAALRVVGELTGEHGGAVTHIELMESQILTPRVDCRQPRYHTLEAALMRWIGLPSPMQEAEARACVDTLVTYHRPKVLAQALKLQNHVELLLQPAQVPQPHVQRLDSDDTTLPEFHEAELPPQRHHRRPAAPPQPQKGAPSSPPALLQRLRDAPSPGVRQKGLVQFYTRQFQKLRNGGSREAVQALLGEMRHDKANGMALDTPLVTSLLQLLRDTQDYEGFWYIVEQATGSPDVHIDAHLATAVLSGCATALRAREDAALSTRYAQLVWDMSPTPKGFRLYTRMMEVMSLAGDVEGAERLVLQAPPVPSLGHVACPYMMEHFERAYALRGVPHDEAVARIRHLISHGEVPPALASQA
eukprot:TRINITY_DN1937_c2_g2_i1.p1 TRINITY_DN1937_c2_g2~~TRINITY_DN1937_c2_g2_i1.p1  ORF type:complete len:782 (+),score=167.42 TRINITY_DN1937_c2_g2_i1:3-2348(+)